MILDTRTRTCRASRSHTRSFTSSRNGSLLFSLYLRLTEFEACQSWGICQGSLVLKSWASKVVVEDVTTKYGMDIEDDQIGVRDSYISLLFVYRGADDNSVSSTLAKHRCDVCIHAPPKWNSIMRMYQARRIIDQSLPWQCSVLQPSAYVKTKGHRALHCTRIFSVPQQTADLIPEGDG